MANPIDLTTLSAVKSWAQLQSTVITGVTATISVGTQIVTPLSMIGILIGMQLTVDLGVNQEQIIVTNISPTTFTAVFSQSHAANSLVTGSPDDLDISSTITATSAYFLWKTGRGTQGGAIPTASPFVTPQAFNENYDGNGNSRMYLRQTPIISVTSITANGIAVPASSGYPYYGYVIGDNKYIGIIGGSSNYPYNYSVSGSYRMFGASSGGFPRGMQNINVQYTAGFTGVPFDIERACCKVVAINYRRRAYADQKSLFTPEGTLAYRDWEFPPEVCSVLENYSRRAVV
jgi:hypothetical protein